ncbi:hypothetical protein [Nonomuraea sp. NPDC050783]|uniref:hypothetical protein n=1 Tax=Nonomuraea sp. NPDC050783 TaxID=3154634 RepID=UPI0034663B21
MSKLDVARLREPAAWIMLVSGLVSVLLAVGHLLIGPSGSTFTGRAASTFFDLTSPVTAALLLGAVLLLTKVGEPSAKARPVTYGAAVGLLLAAVFGMLSLLLGLFAGDGARDTVEFVLLGAPRLALVAVALVYLVPQVLPARPVAQVYHHPQLGQPQPQPGPAPAYGQPPAGQPSPAQPPPGQPSSGQQPAPGYGPQDQPAPAAYGQQPPSGQQPVPEHLPALPEHLPAYGQQPPSGQQSVPAQTEHLPAYGQQPPSGQHAAPGRLPAAQPLSGQHAMPGQYTPPADPQPAYADPQQPAYAQPQQGFGGGQPDSPYAPPSQGFGGAGQDTGYGTNPGFGQSPPQPQPFGQHASYTPADTTPTVDRPAAPTALPDYHTPAPAPDYHTPAPDYATPAPQEYNTPAAEYQPAPYVPADSQPSLYGHPSPNPYASQDPFATPADQSYPTGDTSPSVPFPPSAQPAQPPQQPYYGQNAFDQPQHGGTPFTGYSGAEFAAPGAPVPAAPVPPAPAYQEPDPPVDPRSQQLLDAYQQAETYQSAAGTAPDLRVPDYAAGTSHPYDDPFGHPQHPQHSQQPPQSPYEPQQGGYEPRPYQPSHQAPPVPPAPPAPGWSDAQGESTVRLDPGAAVRGDALDSEQPRPGDDPIHPTAIYTPNEPRR